MRRRGFDVIAKPQQKKYDQQNEIRRLVVGGKWVTVSASNIDQVMKRWGVGSRAILYLAWVKDHAHVINQECTENGVVYVDPQPGMIVDGPRYLNRARNMRLMRVDDKPVTDAISQVVEDPPDVMPEWVPRMVMYHT